MADTSCKEKYGISEIEGEAMENEFEEHPFGTSPDGLAKERAYNATLDSPDGGEASPNDDGELNNARATPASCKDIPEDAPHSLKISPSFTVASFSTQALFKHSVVPNRGLSRSEIICNLRHLAVNCIEPIFTHFKSLGYTINITSGFRPGSGKSDHQIGSAADLQFYLSGALVTGANLTRIQKAIDEHLKLPYTQMIHEANRILHVACRRNGVNSSSRMFWSPGHGRPNGGSKYRHQVSLDGTPPVKK